MFYTGSYAGEEKRGVEPVRDGGLGQGQEDMGTLEGINVNSWDVLASTRVVCVCVCVSVFFKSSKSGFLPH